MNTWVPLWSQVVESTLWEEPLEVRVLFLTMLAIKDPDHVVRLPLRRLVKKAQMTVDQVEDALRILSSPDLRSIDEQPEEGRRIKQVADGWLVVNGEHYKEEMHRLIRRLKKNEWQRADRLRKKALALDYKDDKKALEESPAYQNNHGYPDPGEPPL